jgi:transcriptional regulator with XRE-family HTH domain
MSDQQGDFEFFNSQGVSSGKKSDLERDIESGKINIHAISSVDEETSAEEKSAPREEQFSAANANVIAANGGSYGTVLRRLRESRNLSYEDLAKETCIKTDALQALENEDTDALPPPFYIAAYIKKLCTLYGVSEELTEELSAEVKSTLERTVPEDLSRVVRGHEVSEENEKRIRRLAIILVALAVTAAVLVISGAALLVSHLASGGKSNPIINISINEDTLLKLQEKPKLEIPRLPKKK